MFCCVRVCSSLLLSRHPGAVASSRGERGKPSRGTSERGEQRELETLWSLSSFKWKQLHRAPSPSPFLTPQPLRPPCPLAPPPPTRQPVHPPPPFPPTTTTKPLPHLTSTVTVRPTSCSLWSSVLPGYWRVKGMLQSY